MFLKKKAEICEILIKVAKPLRSQFIFDILYWGVFFCLCGWKYTAYSFRLAKIDSRIMKLVNLTELDMSGNEIESLPDNFDALHSLSELMLFRTV